jgi:hypothetical protein
MTDRECVHGSLESLCPTCKTSSDVGGEKYARYDDRWYFCWLIELRGATPMWWASDGGWEEVATDALWFARRQDADRFASEMSQDVFVCEHGFQLDKQP